MIGRAERQNISWWLEGPLLGALQRLGGAIIVAAGPWLVSVVVLAIVSVTMTPVLGLATVEDLRLTVIYAFCIAPVVAGPVGAVVGRMIGREVEAGALHQAPSVFLAGLVLSGGAAQVVAIAIAVVLGLEFSRIGAGFVFLATAAALLWTSFAALTALKAYRFLIGAFSLGMASTVACIMLAAGGEVTIEMLVWAFTAGLGLCVSLTVVRVAPPTESRAGDVRAAMQALVSEMWKHRALCVGVSLAICAVWVDKWIYWFGTPGVRSRAGFLHYSPYDSVMFVSHLAVIPSYAAMLLFHDKELHEAVSAFRTRLQDRSTFARIRESVDRLGHVVWSGIFTIIFLQAALTACVVMMAPALAEWLDFSFEQFLMLRVGVIAASLHAFFFLSCAVLLVCNRSRIFAALQGGFFLANLGLCSIFYALGGVSGYGFFASALIMSAVAFCVACRSLNQFDFLTVLGENDSLYA